MSWKCWRESWRAVESDSEEGMAVAGDDGSGAAVEVVEDVVVVVVVGGESWSGRLRRTWARCTSGESGVVGCRLRPCLFCGDGVRMFAVCCAGLMLDYLLAAVDEPVKNPCLSANHPLFLPPPRDRFFLLAASSTGHVSFFFSPSSTPLLLLLGDGLAGTEAAVGPSLP